MAIRMSLSGRKILVGAALLGGAALAGVTARPTKAQANGWDHGRDRDGDRDHDRDHEPDRYSIALWGDMPYNALGKQQYPALLASVNASDIEFSVFDGDLKAGGDGPCTDENVYTPALKAFASLKQPMIWLPGDNDWTDCWGRYGAGTSLPGADDPIERLNHERALFTSTPYSLGQHKLRLTRQSSEGGAYAIYSENVRWKLGPVVYIGLDVQGSNDNYPYAGVDGETRSQTEIDRQRAEEVARKAADIAWLNEGFAYAKQVHAAGVMVVFQADLNFNNEQHLADTRSYDAFPDYIAALKAATLAFPGQVVLVHGDSHYFKLDKPLNTDQGGIVGNFTRLETFGSRNTHWVKATIDVRNPNLFTFEPQIVPANLD
ncbi:MAG TPA: hypothetical protein VHO67_23040 [Polyangia bacterium]|nr:hypothetical protein [Polyangia bacterium]